MVFGVICLPRYASAILYNKPIKQQHECTYET